MVTLKSLRWSLRQERSSSQAKANLNDVLKQDSNHIIIDVTWDLAPIDFIYCIGKKNIHSFNRGYYECIKSPLDGKYIIPLNQSRNPEALELWTGLSKPADYLWAKALCQATWLFTSQGLLAYTLIFRKRDAIGKARSRATVAMCKLYCCGVICYSYAAILECANGSFDALIGHPYLQTCRMTRVCNLHNYISVQQSLYDVELSRRNSGEDKVLGQPEGL